MIDNNNDLDKLGVPSHNFNDEDGGDFNSFVIQMNEDSQLHRSYDSDFSAAQLRPNEHVNDPWHPVFSLWPSNSGNLNDVELEASVPGVLDHLRPNPLSVIPDNAQPLLEDEQVSQMFTCIPDQDTLFDQAFIPVSNFTVDGDFLQWIDGAHRPPRPCLYCRQQRLECFRIKTTDANPNPVTACSSCVALFRECSLAVGEKRGPSDFETNSPILGHLHGVTEEENGDLAPGTWQESPKMSCQASQLSTRSPSSEIHVTESSKKPMSRRNIKRLKSWFSEHQDDPYPSEEEKLELITETGLSRIQISNWFANARRRQRQSRAISMPTAVKSHAEANFDDRLRSMSPMQRWQNSPPENEPFDPVIVAQAIKSANEGEQSWISGNIDNEKITLRSRYPAPSVSSFDSQSGLSSDSSHYSAHSHDSHHSYSSITRPKQRRSLKRKHRKGKETSKSGKFYCTFCGENFKRKHDWDRHEKTIHLAMEHWICSPGTGVITKGNEEAKCLFCCTTNPTQEHLEEHDVQSCAERPVAQRTFRRKDHLRQHLSKFHRCSRLPDGYLDSWKVVQSELRSRCGFCDASLGSWDERIGHLAAHFKTGLAMDDWAGDWGFEDHVMVLLQDATLPQNQHVNERPSSAYPD